jgi:hypothetical protein
MVDALERMVQGEEKFEIEVFTTKKIDYLSHDYLPSKLKELLVKLEDDDKKVNVYYIFLAILLVYFLFLPLFL